MEKQEKLPAYKDESLSFRERAEDLVSRMTIEECASQLLFEAARIERLGVEFYGWWNEALHGVARAGLATVFPQAIGLAATFDSDLVRKAADVISTEGRAKYNEFRRKKDYGCYKGLTYWSPNINIFRDPRWGRGQETYGEDPYLTARLGVAYVRGLQGNDGKYLKAAACAKHYAVHSGPEKIRHEFDAVVSQKDLNETYLPAFEALVKEAHVEGVMGAYNRTNGEPCCGSKTLLVDILRGKWGFDGYVTSDCGAIADFHLHHHVTGNALESVALALKNGCDLNCGNMYGNLLQALKAGLITEEDIRKAAVHVMTTRFRLGMFDKDVPYDNIPYEVVDCEEHRRLNYEIACRSLVLLRNDGLLPVDKSRLRNVAVIGPNADSIVALRGNYHGTAGQYYTVLEGVAEALPGVRVYYSEGSHLYKGQLEGPGFEGDRLSEAQTIAERADLVILAVGYDESIEGEEMGHEGFTGDRRDLLLPKSQRDLIRTVLDCGKPTVIVCMTGSAVDLEEANDRASAIIQAWYPGAMGGKAIADLIFGKFSPSGRLPVTFYHNTDPLPPFEDYSMEGRTYRYLKTKPLYPFGYGLSYTTFDYSPLKLEKQRVKAGETLNCRIAVTNTGSRGGEEIVQCYIHADTASVRVPKFQLCAIKRVALKPGESKEIELSIPPEAMRIVMEDGNAVFEPGRFTLYAGGGQPDERTAELTGRRPQSASFELI